MINPFDLRGPAFLIFYAILGIMVNLILRYIISQREMESSATQFACTDPYKLAALRGGINETLRIVLFSLIDRGLLKATDTAVAAEPQAKDMVRRPIEEAVVSYFQTPRQVQGIFSDSAAMAAGMEYSRELAEEGLISDSSTNKRRQGSVITALILLVGVSLTKIVIALSRGRYNILFLIILTVVFAAWAMTSWRRERTGAGDELLRIERLRFNSLKEQAGRIRPGGMTNDASFLVALFGLAALPSTNFPFIATLFPRAVYTPGGNYSGGCGGGGGEGGGCGGGGCGGGCGGCGG